MHHRQRWLRLLLFVMALTAGLASAELLTRLFLRVPQVGPAFTVYDPVYGKRMRPYFRATRVTPEFRYTLETNSLGLRGPEPVQPLRDGLLFIGDSFTLGVGVEEHETFAGRIRARLHAEGRRVPVLNAGVGNAGNGFWIKLLEREVPAWNPRVVVLQMMANDFADNLRDGLYELDDQGALRERAVPAPGFGRRAQAWIERIPGLSYSHLVGLAWSSASAVQGRAPVVAQPGVAPRGEARASDALTYALLQSAIQRCRQLGALPLVMLVEIHGQHRAELRNLLEAEAVPWLEVPSIEQAPELYYPVDGHWNAQGHAAAAKLLWPRVRTRLGSPLEAQDTTGYLWRHTGERDELLTRPSNRDAERSTPGPVCR